MRELAVIAVGYLLGSFLPAEALARARGVDIRAVGTHNPGTTNALHQLGLVEGLITGAYDASVGLVTMWLGWQLGLPAVWIYLGGLMTIVGHRRPLFSRFRGGEGMATTTAMILWAIGYALYVGWLPGWALAALVGVAAIVFALTRSATDVGVFVAPILLAVVLLGRPDPAFAGFFTVLAAHIWLTQLAIARRERLLRLAQPAASWLAVRRLRPR